jgi:hypothetical protein
MNGLRDFWRAFRLIPGDAQVCFLFAMLVALGSVVYLGYVSLVGG